MLFFKKYPNFLDLLMIHKINNKLCSMFSVDDSPFNMYTLADDDGYNHVNNFTLYTKAYLIKQHVPKAKILITLRDPIVR